ncbi:SAM-dependent methyltransferase, partial [Clostridium sp. cpc1]
MKLSPRLLAIQYFVKKNSIVADIGTDHGYIPVHLIENNISKKVIAAD